MARHCLLVVESLSSAGSHLPLLADRILSFEEVLASVFRQTADMVENTKTGEESLSQTIPTVCETAEQFDGQSLSASIPFLLENDFQLPSADNAFLDQSYGPEWDNFLSDIALSSS